MKRTIILLAAVTLLFASISFAWDQIPGATSDAPVVVWIDDYLKLIAVRGVDDGIYFCMIDGHPTLESPRGYWSGWHQIAGETSSTPAIAYMGDLEGYQMFSIIVRGLDDKIYFSYFFTRIDDSPDAPELKIFHLKMQPR